VIAVGATLRIEMKPRTLIAIVSPAVTQSDELMRKALDFRSSLTGVNETTRLNSTTLELVNGSRLVIKPAGHRTGVRGLSQLDTLIVDEAAQIEEEDWSGMTPAINEDGGQLIVASTPWARSGRFMEMVRNPKIKTITARADMIPRRAAYVEQQRTRLSDREFQREIMLEPSAAGQTFFSLDRVDQSVVHGGGLVL